MNNIYQYLEYRDYLKDFYEEQKETKPFFSFRYLGNKLGLDPSFLVKVFQREKHLANKAIPVVIDFLKLESEERKYFQLLVSFNKAKKSSDVQLFYEKLISYRKTFAKKLPKEKFEFFGKWYHSAIYELLSHSKFKGTFSELAKSLRPTITLAEAKESISLLIELNLIEKEQNGVYNVIDDVITTGEKWDSAAIHNFKKTIIALEGEALDNIPKSERDISSVTVSVSQKTLNIMKERLQVYRKELLEIAKDDENPEAVMQINFGLFPLTQWNKGGGNE